MKITKTALIIGAFFGFTGVILSAMGAHALKEVLEPKQLNSFNTATRIQTFHALFLLFLGLFSMKKPSKILKIAIYLTIIGTTFFSGSIYLLINGIKAVALVTPLGGILLITAWFLVFITAIKLKENDSI